MKVLVTGAGGFLGSGLLPALTAIPGLSVRGAIRQRRPDVPDVELDACPELAPAADWRRALSSVDVVIHLAARVHVMRDRAADPLAEFRRVNVQGTLSLARQAAAAGVRRFVLMSSIKVNGEHTAVGRPFTAADAPRPHGPYAQSKLEAEIGLQRLATDTGMQFVIVRPPLVYGPGVGANFQSMMRWVSRGVPLPLGAIRNQRSLVALDNLVDLLVLCVDHAGAANRVLLVADGEDLSTPQLLERLGRALGRPARLVNVPPAILGLGARLLGRRDVFLRLCDSLQVDTTDTRERLSWCPPVSVDAALRRTAAHSVAAAHLGSRATDSG